jgi:hypothetical protein
MKPFCTQEHPHCAVIQTDSKLAPAVDIGIAAELSPALGFLPHYRYREHYQLYEGKPCITDTAEECRKCLNVRVSMIGKRLRQGAWGDPPNFLAPVAGVDVRALQQAQAAGVSGSGA